jgi:divalent metal cation (Fe/Co/Zn/Cd) transporter
LTGAAWLDGLVAILVGLYVLWTGYGLVRKAVLGLMDRANVDLLARLVDVLQQAREPGWIDLHQLRAWQAGDATFVDFHLVVPAHWTVARIHETHVRARDLLRRALGEATEIIIHFDPVDRRLGSDAASRPWTVQSAVRVPQPGELGSEPAGAEPPGDADPYQGAGEPSRSGAKA